MTRYEWRTIREAERNEMRQRQIRLGKIRKQGRDETLCGILALLAGIGFVALAQLTDIADTGLVFLAVLMLAGGLSSVVHGTKKWTR